MTTNAPTSSSDATPSKSISKGDILLNVHEAQLPFIWRRNLGSGSCGIVEEVQDSNSGLLYARKRLLLRSWNKKSMQELFKNEVEIIESLGEHHHIIQIFATYTTKDILGIILYPVAESGDLHEYLANFHELRTSPKANQAEFDKRIVVLRQAFGCLAEGLSYMHERKIRHKDIKAQNILIHQDKIMYTDFGLSLDSKLLENSTTEDLAGMTRRYAAPEVIQNRPRNSFSDIFALGCVFLEIFSALTTGIPFLQQGEYSEAMPRIHTLLRSAEYPIELYSIFQTIIAMTSESVEVRPSAKFVATSLLGSPGFGCPQCCFNNTSAGVDGSQSQTLPPASSPASTNFSLGYIDDARSADKLHNTPRDVVPARIGFRTRMLSKFAVRTPPRSVAPSYDPLGLTVIYQPESQPSLDIIFVHGINGTSRSSWSKDRDPEYFWPGKWLPFEPHISSARIISFGYRSNFASTDGSTDIGIADFAKDLLFEMKFARNGASTELELGKRPIIFVAHSMGGLVVKQAYVLGRDDQNYSELVSSISAILFLATPHRGSELAKILNRILTVSSSMNGPKLYLRDLEHDSPTVQTLNEQFRQIAAKLDIFSFYETLYTTLGTQKVIIVEKQSAVLGYPGEISRSLIADHRTINKYDSPYDINYVIVRNTLKTLVANVTSKDESLRRN